ncbi:MAG: site-specific integrase [Kiritimatiellae bacterium]|nr:site-specific integrase [Kiritimatiellia bacterium]
MASVHHQTGTKYWIAHFTDKDGKRRVKSTKLTDRAKALKVAAAWEESFRARNAVEHIRTAFNSLAREIDPSAAVPTVKEYFKRWVEGHGGELAPRTLASYEQRLRQFGDFVGDDLSIDMVKPSHALAFRGLIAENASAATANLAIKVLRAVFACAMNEGVVMGNAFKLKALDSDSVEKQAFTVPQVRRLLEVANPEWRSLILFALYTGQRLGDLVTLTWSQIDFNRKEILFRTEKTSRRMAIPACDTLWAHILTLKRGTPTAPLHPNACALKDKHGIGLVSKDFTRLMVTAGLCAAKPNNKKREKKGDVSREVNPLTFHSLRHAAATWLRDAGVSESLAMELIGHDSVSVDRSYVHTSPDAMRNALNALPALS